MIESRLQVLSPMPLKVIWHQNKTTYLTIRKSREGIRFRLHILFQNASDEVLKALIQMALKRDREAKAIVRKMAHLYFSTHKEAPKSLEIRGKFYDLGEIGKKIQGAYFEPEVEPSIGWSKGRFSQFRSMTFGTYHRQQNQVRINSLLDDEQVPLYFVEFIVYHEMLHAVCQSEMSPRGRCTVHTKAFRMKEKLFAHYEAAKAWEKGSLSFFKAKHRPRKKRAKGILNWLFGSDQ